MLVASYHFLAYREHIRLTHIHGNIQTDLTILETDIGHGRARTVIQANFHFCHHLVLFYCIVAFIIKYTTCSNTHLPWMLRSAPDEIDTVEDVNQVYLVQQTTSFYTELV